LEGFGAVTKAVNLAVGWFSILFGFMAIYDVVSFKLTNETKGMLLQLPKSVKEQIHKVIRTRHTGDKKNIFALIVSAVVTGFLVTLLEAVCTGQTYLPIIAFILKSEQLRVQAFVYLVLYNMMFILPLIVIFVCALMGVSSSGFSDILKRNLVLVKVLMAIVFFALGLFLILKA
jgi:hypothetical protein